MTKRFVGWVVAALVLAACGDWPAMPLTGLPVTLSITLTHQPPAPTIVGAGDSVVIVAVRPPVCVPATPHAVMEGKRLIVSILFRGTNTCMFAYGVSMVLRATVHHVPPGEHSVSFVARYEAGRDLSEISLAHEAVRVP